LEQIRSRSGSATESHPGSDLVKTVLLAAVYALSARLGLQIHAVHTFATLVWPPTGIALVALLLWGPRFWPGVMAGALLANLWTGASLPVALAIGAGNTLEALLGAWALRKIPGFSDSLERLQDVLGLIVFAAMASSIVSATVGVLSLGISGFLGTGSLWVTWRAWWLGDALGDLVVAPFLLTLRKSRLPSPGGRVEAVLLGVLVGLMSFVTFRWNPADTAAMLSPFLVWAALRFELRGAARAMLVVSAIAIWATIAGYGPFVRSTVEASLFSLQSFVAVTAATFLVLAAASFEWRRAREEAQDANSARDQVLTGMAEGFCTVDRQHRLTYMNDAAERLLGRPRAELLGASVLEELVRGDEQVETFRRAMDGAAGRFETFIPPCGRWLAVVASPSPRGVSLLLRDVTARKQSEESLQRYAAIVESSQDAIIALTLDGVIVSWNPAAERMFGYEGREVLGRVVSMLMPPEHRGDLNLILGRIRRGERVEHFETIRLKKNGDRIIVSLSVSPIRNSSGGVVGASKIARDITERKRAQEAALETQRQLSTALAAARMGAWSWDIGTAKVAWSERLEEIHGLSPGAAGLTYEAFLERIHPEDRPRVLAEIRRAVEQKCAYDAEYRVVFPDQSTHWVAGYGHVFVDETDKPARMVGIGLDITQRKRDEAERERLYLEAQEGIRVRDAFLSVAGHEFRTPLGALTLTLYNLDRALRADAGSPVREKFRGVQRQVDRLVRLTEDLLAAGRIHEGRLKIEVSRTDLVRVVSEVVERLGEAARDAGCSILFDVPGPVWGIWDPSRLDQVVTNILDNAIKFGRGRPIAVEILDGGRTATLSVRDQGPGIDPADQERIFERFERAASERSYRGMGLGLWIARQIVEQHGGTIDVESEIGAGASFRVVLPLGGEGDADSDRG
jgi:PAS domain S-box-containing protein